MNNFGVLSISDAIKIVNNYDAMARDYFNENVFSLWEQRRINEENLSQYDLNVRRILLETFDKYYDHSGKNLYELDLRMGLAIYNLLDPDNSDFTVSDASDDDMWRYISVKIIPDMTTIRYPASKESGAKNINKKRFYSDKRRIWIKSLWWYIYLSWQGDEISTYRVLADNAIDNINKLIETPGRGYRLSLYRALMKEYSTRSHNTDYFAGVTKLNNAKCRTLEPALMYNGESEYVKDLFDEVPVSKGREG